ncbi:spore coat protein GerQ [Lentibacillus sp. Marseille-P4043]|uniref:spore coat protein GerQ n=1 Tax=Lentibacillus sp. Marseille-P4043 TaxID=2040293 RepID=UPI000D0B0AF3|nr:spore coat protein GerQ [Lentibacillus sp. Marseille-P4043]
MSEKKDTTNQAYGNAAYQAYPYYYYPQTSQAYYPVYDYRQQYPQQQVQQPPVTPSQLPAEQSYIENILRLNEGKLANVYMTFENNQEKVFKGVVEAAGRDHIILRDPQTNKRYLLLMVYLDYITFNEEINYSYPYGQMSTYPSR